MKIDEFARKYGLTAADVHVRINQGNIPRHTVTTTSRRRATIDEDFFIRRNKFREEVRLYIQDMYFLFSRVVTNSRLAELVGVSVPYFTNTLWAVNESKILSYKINESDWKFYRFCKKVEGRIRRRWGITFDISEILDNEARLSA